MYLRIMKDLYSENYRRLPTTVTGGLSNWRDVPHSWVARLTMANAAFLPRCIHGFHAIPTTLPGGFFFRGGRGLNKLTLIDGKTKDAE